jgi:UDP-arabinose 4-epimerase
MQGVPVLVVGGAGYIGSHTAKMLAASGFAPVVYDNFSRGSRELARWGRVVEGDMGDRARLDAVIAEVRPVGCIHFAAYAYVGESVADPAIYYRNNVAGTLTLLEALVAAGVGRVVFSSTCATFGDVEGPIDEATRQTPANPYGETKLVVERMLRAFDVAYGLRSATLRYFNAAGADPDGETGSLHDPETRLIPRALMAAAGRIPHLEVYGTDYPTPDGTAIRDYVHVTDLAQAHVLALRRLIDGAPTDAFNLGTGTGTSVRAILAAAEAATGLPVPVRYGPRRAGDPPSLVADTTKSRGVLGFRPRFTEIGEIVETAWRWHRTRWAASA